MIPCSDFIHQKLLGFLAVVDRIVHLLAHQFVVLYQMMVRALGEKEWGEIEGIYQYAVELEIVGIVMNEVMSADIVNLSFLQELVQCRLRCLVKVGSVITQCSDVVYFMVFQSHFGIHEGNVPASGIFLHDVRAYDEIVLPSKEATEY